jgi:purine-binding chemotaxis protein CheW
VPVLDIRRRFGLAPRPVAHTDYLVLAHPEGRQVALRVDQVHDLVTVRQEDLLAASAVPELEFVAGVARLPDGLVLIHDLCTFLSAPEAAEIDQALAVVG